MTHKGALVVVVVVVLSIKVFSRIYGSGDSSTLLFRLLRLLRCIRFSTFILRFSSILNVWCIQVESCDGGCALSESLVLSFFGMTNYV